MAYENPQPGHPVFRCCRGSTRFERSSDRVGATSSATPLQYDRHAIRRRSIVRLRRIARIWQCRRCARRSRPTQRNAPFARRAMIETPASPHEMAAGPRVRHPEPHAPPQLTGRAETVARQGQSAATSVRASLFAIAARSCSAQRTRFAPIQCAKSALVYPLPSDATSITAPTLVSVSSSNNLLFVTLRRGSTAEPCGCRDWSAVGSACHVPSRKDRSVVQRNRHRGEERGAQ